MNYIKSFFTLNLKDYTEAKLDFPIGAVLLLSLIAISLALFVITYRKRYTVAMVRALIRNKAFNPAGAKTLSQLKLSGNRGLERALSRSGQLTYIVKRFGEEKLDYEEYIKRSKEKGYKDEAIDFSSAKFYINADELDRARSLVDKTNTSWWLPSVCSAVLLVILILAFIFLPDLLALLK